MKSWKKAILLVIVIMSIVLACSRYYVIKNNFFYSIHNISSVQNYNQNILEKYMLESNIIQNIQDGKEVTYETITEYLKSLEQYMEDNSELVALYTEEHEKLYSTIDDIDKIDISSLLTERQSNYALRKIGNKHYMLFSSYWSINAKTIYVVNAYDVSNIYEERNRQLKETLIRDVGILSASSIIIFVLAKLVTNHVDKLNLLVKQREDFINGFTHELKTPMTVIMGYADLLRLKKCDEEISQKALNYIYTESKRLETLSLKLMKLMSLTDEKLELEVIEASSFINNFVDNEDFNLNGNKLEIDMTKYYIKGDKELLEVVIRNLVENANKAEPKDNKIYIKGEIIGNKKYRISVIDKGKGIPKKHISRVTEDFYMVDKSRSRSNGGSGIGLSLVKKILEFHNSMLHIESVEGEGTTIYFDLKGAEDEIK
ncbi:MAG: HAMP domain-containing sensor histidine kinase [Clostridia bacterium]|nr:HAMP domain-containing sensor histidine kinase [Clostridia bacterium]